jgi:heat shock protein HtpX
MAMNAYQVQAGDWRRQLRLNNRRTYIIISLFLLIYLSLGLLVDMVWLASNHPKLDMLDIAYGLSSLQFFPIATLLLTSIAIVSLCVTFALHDKLMLLGTDYHEINLHEFRSSAEQQLYNVVEEMQVAAGLRYAPKLYLIDADYMNAFASGYSERSAMMAVTRGLVLKLNRSELQAVVAHELSHIRHMDIKLTLMASVLSNIMVIVLDILFRVVLYNRGRGESRGKGQNQLYMLVMVLRFVLPLLTILLTLYLSRTREYMADAGAVELMRDNQPLANALLKIQADTEQNQDVYGTAYATTAHEGVRQAAYIFDPKQAGISLTQSFGAWFSTHPSIAKRLAALGISQKP